MLRYSCFFICLFITTACAAQQFELNEGWRCQKAEYVHETGEQLTRTLADIRSEEPIPDKDSLGRIWSPAVVPGTVLTTLLHNQTIPDPFYGMNNELIPDIYKTGPAEYTYWFLNHPKINPPAKNERIYLDFRGVNYSYDVYLNGKKVNDQPETGMFLRSSFDITDLLNKYNRDDNKLAILVRPPNPVGNPNGGQGGDGTIAHSITTQYAAGWDWIQPIRDRNTGIWDKVIIRRTGAAHIENTHVVTLVPGRRTPAGRQKPAYIHVTTEAENTLDTTTISGTIVCEIAGRKVSTAVKLEPHTMQQIELPELQVEDPQLWWPNGYGRQNLYPVKVTLVVNKKTMSEDSLNIGIRQIKTVWNNRTGSREVRVNGQKIFIKGGNWIATDAMLRLSDKRYDDEVHMHHDMNLNLIRVWGGGITERPEFYNACDKYGLLVMQDFWVSGDCNGRWYDPLKTEDTNARRKYPDDHNLFIASLEDQIKMLRNHPSLALWCGGNEIRPPQDVLTALRDSLLPQLDGTRTFFEFSNDDSMSLHGGDGPYVLQQDNYFWQHRSFPFNSEIGSVGLGDLESLERVIPPANMKVPYYDTAQKKWIVDSVWRYHKYEGYDSVIEAYGHAKDIKDFTQKAQLVNYNQYRALEEGAAAKMWDWYTGIIIWKTQNPWSCLKGQMYDCYLDQNACLYGTAEGAKPIHVMYDPIHKTVMAVNNTFAPTAKQELVVKAYTMHGDELPLSSSFITVPASKSITCYPLGKTLDSITAAQGAFLYLSITDSTSNTLTDENLYWLPDSKGQYSGLQHMPEAKITTWATPGLGDTVLVTLTNPPGNPVAFFNRVSVINPMDKKRVLPTFYSDNYISILPGGERNLSIYCPGAARQVLEICVEGMNVAKQYFPVVTR